MIGIDDDRPLDQKDVGVLRRIIQGIQNFGSSTVTTDTAEMLGESGPTLTGEMPLSRDPEEHTSPQHPFRSK